jgi:hypothetical protein
MTKRAVIGVRLVMVLSGKPRWFGIPKQPNAEAVAATLKPQMAWMR